MTVYVSTSGEDRGSVDVDDGDSPITASGFLIGSTVSDGSDGKLYRPAGTQKVAVSGSLKHKRDGKALIIDTVSVNPKRTAIGGILTFHLALRAIDEGCDQVGTDLSALEEGTPEFYEKIGLVPSDEWVAAQNLLVDAEAEAGRFPNDAAKEKRRLYLHYSGALRAPTAVVLRKSQESFGRYWKEKAK